MEFSPLTILPAIIVAQLLLLALFLLTSTKGKKLSNRILAFFFLWLALNLCDGVLSYYGFYQRFPSLAHLEDGFILLKIFRHDQQLISPRKPSPVVGILVLPMSPSVPGKSGAFNVRMPAPCGGPPLPG